jgi:hypothetical protein
LAIRLIGEGLWSFLKASKNQIKIYPFIHQILSIKLKLKLTKKSYEKILIFTMLVLLSVVEMKNVNAEEISVNQTFTADTSFDPFPSQEITYTLKISGYIEMFSPASLARVIVNTDKGDFLVVEAFPLISSDTIFEFTAYGDETVYLDGLTPYEIRVEVLDASIYIQNLFFDKEEVEDAATKQYQEKKIADHRKVDLINFNISEWGMDWIAGNTALVDLYYKDKKELYGEKYNLLGYDYYIGGVYQIIGKEYQPVTDLSLVNHWDWRERHGANNPNSPYFDEDYDNLTGWLTIPKNQGFCGACGIFGTLSALEGVINLYYNQHLDLDLSEQHLLSCVPQATCSGVNIGLVMEYLEDYGVVDETCSPYLANDQGDCEDPIIVCTEPDILAKINSSTHLQGSLTSDWEDIFLEMILNGPIGLTITNGTHHVALVGWTYNGESEELFIIYKDSQGYEDFGDHGFMIEQVDGNYLEAYIQEGPYFEEILVQPTVQVWDKDDDGYCWWGIGPKPIGCDTCPSQRDCDDSNPSKGPYNTDYSCYCDDNFASYDTLRITTTTTWPGIVKLESPLSIENGGQLTITGTVYAPSVEQIIIKRGGKLIIDGGKITKSCDNLWKGIQVWGDSTLSQYPYSNQGYLSIINSGCIEYAHTAVYVGKKVSDTPYYTHSGGIVICDDAMFLNNEIDVEFLPFINDHFYYGNEMPNFSGFRKTIFKTYDPEFVLPKPLAHVILDGVNGVDFYGCSFETEELTYYPLAADDRGIGILVYDSPLIVTGICTSNTIPCTAYDSCYFINLRYGIKAFGSGGSDFLSISGASFNTNVAGIYLSGYHESEIIASYFHSDIAAGNVEELEDKFFGGIYLDESTGYHIEGNHFDGPYYYVGGHGNGISRIGIYVDNSGEADNEIYNNLFTGLDGGIVAEGVNKGGEEFRTGLCLKCNDFLHCINDIMVFPDPLYPRERNMGIKTDQGSNSTLSTALAGNTFTSEIQDYQGEDGEGNQRYYWSYYNDAEYINYYHHAENLNFVTYPSEDNYTDESISLINKGTLYNKNEACPSSLNNNNNHLKSMVDSRAEIAIANLQLDTLLVEYYNLVDGGNTESMNFEIVTSMPDEALELRQELLASSPYLSDTVMKNAILKEMSYPMP